MAENFFKSNIVTGLAAGVGATLLAPVLLPALANIVKPVTKAIIKAGIVLYEKGTESVAEWGEVVDDLVAEAKSELESGVSPGAASSVGQVAPAGEQTGSVASVPAPSQGSDTGKAAPEPQASAGYDVPRSDQASRQAGDTDKVLPPAAPAS